MAATVLLAGCGAAVERAVQAEAPAVAAASPDPGQDGAPGEPGQASGGAATGGAGGAGGSATGSSGLVKAGALDCPGVDLVAVWVGDLASTDFGAPAPKTPEGALKLDLAQRRRGNASNGRMEDLRYERIATKRDTVEFAGRREDGTVASTTIVQRSTKFERWAAVGGSACATASPGPGAH